LISTAPSSDEQLDTGAPDEKSEEKPEREEKKK